MIPGKPTWRVPAQWPLLLDDEAHVWRASLEQTPAEVERLTQPLSEDEKERAARFRFPRHRDHFIVARGLLRLIIGRYLQAPASSLVFSYGAYGKPELGGVFENCGLRFNLSHSHELVLCALTRRRAIGVDVEGLRPDVVEEGVAERFFSAAEVKALRALPERLQVEAFFNCWTRKEAYIKAIGEGLSHPLDQFDVSLVPGEPAALLGTRGDPWELERWALFDLAPRDGYAAALAIEGRDMKIEYWDYLGNGIKSR
ncbi:MAG TPA: 4'-phosphopantetheinyl transferase superfamily protein, partial [Blastocatellia bacterium]|nr:4'-phosphopantetheinyl transferase superfamily protein [Blastocatellia bacterium]